MRVRVCVFRWNGDNKVARRAQKSDGERETEEYYRAVKSPMIFRSSSLPRIISELKRAPRGPASALVVVPLLLLVSLPSSSFFCLSARLFSPRAQSSAPPPFFLPPFPCFVVRFARRKPIVSICETFRKPRRVEAPWMSEKSYPGDHCDFAIGYALISFCWFLP